MSHVEEESFWRDRAADALCMDDDAVRYFRSGAIYLMTLLGVVEFYLLTGRETEAMDIVEEMKKKYGAADCRETMAKNMLRIGLAYMEFDAATAGKLPPQTDWKTLLEKIRRA